MPEQSERIRDEVIRIGLAVVPLNTESPVVGGVTVTTTWPVNEVLLVS